MLQPEDHFKLVKMIDSEESINISAVAEIPQLKKKQVDEGIYVLLSNHKISLLYSVMEIIINCSSGNKVGKILVKNFISCRLFKKRISVLDGRARI